MHFKTGYGYKFEKITEALHSYGYRHVPLVLNPGDYSIRGSIVDIFPGNQNIPLRFEFLDDELEEIRSFESSTQRSVSVLDKIDINPLEPEHRHKEYIIPHEILFTLNKGDHVVHMHHGIGIYQGLTRINMGNFEGEYAVVEYQDNDKIFIPIEQLTRIYKYTGTATPAVNSLRDNKWQQTKKRVKKAVKRVAKDLFFLYKKRKINKGFQFQPDTELDLDLEESFIYEETTDQHKAIAEVKKDMESDKPMDRLLCGDVGFGKTEVVLRAAFKAVLGKKQVAILAPTTILSKQHYQVFASRLKHFGVNVAYLNRFKTKKEQQQTIADLKSGKIDIIIGTHRLLSKDVGFFDLGLLVIDEEQRFGVMAKEKIKQMRVSIDVLTVSATPLPRTLYLSVSGVRDISVLNTPPLKRLSIITEAHVFDIKFIKQKIEFEIKRGGQVFFLHNRIHDIVHLQNKIKAVLPDLDVRIAHGQMKSRELEAIIMDFYENKFPVLLSTTIIENGVDIPNTHTIIINNADKFGLAQLHQLRGRVGRNEIQSYAYLIYQDESKFSLDVHDRFEALIEFSTLGSGYDISLRDLELRGIGNILGTEQSGYMEAIGFDLYMYLLNDAMALERGEKVERPRLWQISNKTSAYISEDYIPDMTIRLALYKRIAEVENQDQIDDLMLECQDRFGPLPENLEMMLEIIRREFI